MTESQRPSLSYRDAGVDIDAGDQLVEDLPLALAQGTDPTHEFLQRRIDCIVLSALQGGPQRLKDGLVVQTNFNKYRSLRINEMPDVELTIVPSTEAPTGIGEPGLPCVAPAVANAMARLGLGRPRRLPFIGGIV